MDTVVWNRPNHCVMMQRRRMCGCCVAWGGDAHGGVYCEGDSPYNLERHLQTHPELYAVDADGNSTKFSIDAVGIRVRLSNTSIPGPSGFYHACPSRPENQEFVAESLTWLFKNLELGGVWRPGESGRMPSGYRICKPMALSACIPRVRSVEFFPLRFLMGTATMAKKATSKDPVIFLIISDRGIRSKVAEMIRKNGHTVEEYESAREFLIDKVDHKSGAVFVDASLSEISGIQLGEILASERDAFPCVVMSTCRYASRALAAGLDLIIKPVTEESFLAAIDRCNSPHVFSPEDLRWGFNRLSLREKEVLGFVVQGITSDAIAAKIGTSVKTVEAHRSRIMLRLRADDVGELARIWKAWQAMQ